MKISVCLSIRNGEKYIQYLDRLFNEIEGIYKDFSFEYFIYENNSTDNTKEMIHKFSKNRNCKYLLENIINNRKMLKGISRQRGAYMACIRNKLKDFHQSLDSDYVLLLDCDVVFLPDTIEKLIQSINHGIVMVSPFCICEDYYFKNNHSIHYYDSLAVISNDNISYLQTDNTCLFNNCTKCIRSRDNHKIKIPFYRLFPPDKIIFVKSCFGSMSLIKTEVYNNVRWGDSVCEHHSFCNEIRKHGHIVINTHIKTFTCHENADYNLVEKELKHIVNKQ